MIVRQRKLSLWAGMWSAAVGTLVLGMTASAPVRAQESEPVAVVSIQSLNALLGSPVDDEDVGAVGHLLALAGYDDFASMGKGFSLPFTRGIKRDLPWGVLVRMDGDEFKTVIFVPTDDIKLILRPLRAQIGEFDVRDDGLIQIELPFLFQPAYIKQVGGWAYASTDLELLADVPADPRTLLAGLDAKYVVGAQIYPGNIPEDTRKSWIELMRSGMRSAMEDSDPEEAAGQMQAAEMQIRTVETLLTETEAFTVGLEVDPMAGETVLEIAAVGAAESEMAKQGEMLKTATTRFAQFARKDAAASMQFVAPLTPYSVKQWQSMKESVQEAALKQIENDEDLSDEDKTKATQAMNNFIAVLGETLKSGKLDFAGYLTTDDKLNAVFAGAVADGKKLEASVKDLVTLGRESSEDVIVEFDLETFEGVTMHHLAIPIKDDPESEDDDEAAEASRKIFGANVDLYLGFNADTIYASVGPGSLDTLKATIKQATKDQTKVAVPQSLRVSAKDLGDFLVPLVVKDQDKRSDAVKIVKDMGANNTVNLEITPSDKGTTTRISVGDDVVKMIGSMARLGQEEDDFDF